MKLPEPALEKVIVDQITDCDKDDTVFGKRWSMQVIGVTEEDIAALRAGKFLAIDVNAEYVIYLRANRSASKGEND